MSHTTTSYHRDCVDVHTHVVPREFPRYVGRHSNAPWPSTRDASPCHRHVILSGNVYRTVSDQCWDVAVRLADMDRLRVMRQVLSPMPELLSYWLDPDDGVALSRYLNTTIAEMVAAAPTRFSGLGTVPLQDLDRAITELEYLTHQLGLSGVEIGSNINGMPVGHPHLQPFFEAAEQWGAAVFVHPLRPAGMSRLVGAPMLEQVAAFPGEIGLAVVSMITGGTLLLHPNLRIAFSHGGGSLQVAIARLQHAWDIVPSLRETIAVAPRDVARYIYYDDLLYDAGAIERLIQVAGDTQVMMGSDYPFPIMDSDPAGRVESLQLDELAKAQLRRGNAYRWLGLAS